MDAECGREVEAVGKSTDTFNDAERPDLLMLELGSDLRYLGGITARAFTVRAPTVEAQIHHVARLELDVLVGVVVNALHQDCSRLKRFFSVEPCSKVLFLKDAAEDIPWLTNGNAEQQFVRGMLGSRVRGIVHCGRQT